MLLLVIFGILFLLCFIAVLVLRLNGYCKGELAFSNFLLGLCAIISIGSFIGTFKCKAVAESRYTNMLIEKSWIEENINSDDIFSSVDAYNRYFQYQFKLERMQESKENGLIASIYYFYDINALELNIGE